MTECKETPGLFFCVVSAVFGRTFKCTKIILPHLSLCSHSFVSTLLISDYTCCLCTNLQMSHQLVTSIEMLSLGKLRIHGNPSICNPLLNECGNPDALILGIG